MIHLPNQNKGFLISACATAILLAYYISLGAASNTLNIIGAIVLTITSLVILRSKGGWLFLLYAFSLTFALTSNALIEITEVFLIEIRETAYLTGGAARNAFLASLFLIASYSAYLFFLKIIPNKIPTISKAEPAAHRIFLIIAFAAPLYITATLAIYGSPLILGIDRFTYFTNIAPPGYTFVYGNIPILGFAVNLSAFKGLIRNRTSTTWLILTTITYIMAGEKFSQIILLAFFYLTPSFIINNKKIQTKQLLIGITAIAAMAALIFINYTLIYGSAEILIPRLALQGQMNYALDKIAGSAKDLGLILRHFIGVSAPEPEHGLAYLMHLVAPSNIVDLRLESGATFTAPFPANISYFFGKSLSPLPIALTAIALGAISALVHKTTKSLNLLFSLLAIKTFLLIYVSITMGAMNLLLGPKAALHLIAILFYLIIAHAFSRKKI